MNLFSECQNSAESRRREIVLRIAEKAYALPLLKSGLWFHDDIRNNFYYASYLFAAAVDDAMPVSFERARAAELAHNVLREVLLLQNTAADSPLYGHWPLWIGPVPRETPANALPVEIMGSLMLYFRHRFGEKLSTELREMFDAALGHVYRSGFYRKPLAHYSHHEAKYTAAKLIFGRRFGDRELLKDGHDSLRSQLRHIRENGMREYGSLPWFWHWVQAFTCALELLEQWDREAEARGERTAGGEANREVGGERTARGKANGERTVEACNEAAADACGERGGESELRIGGSQTELRSDPRSDLKEMLDVLWRIRAEFYLGGAWVGAHARGWPHDVPRDGNVLHDYVQFGGFPLPEDMPRTEYAGFLYHEAPGDAVRTAMDRSVPVEVKKRIVLLQAGEEWHSYAYITEEYAAGGLWERVEEFDNEQLRWAFTLPVQADGGVNRLYFFHPGNGYREGDPRHQSKRMEVLYHRSVIAAWFPEAEEGPDFAVGVLPLGRWVEKPQALYGQCGSLFFAVHLSHGYKLIEREGFREVQLPGLPGGVVVEAASESGAAALGIPDFDAFVEAMDKRAPEFAVGADWAVRYRSLQGDQIALAAGSGKSGYLNGKPMSWDGYSIG